MDGETENKVRRDGVVSPDSPNEKDNSVVTVNRNETEGVPAEMVAWDQDEENSESMRATDEVPVEEAVTSEPQEILGNEFLGVDDITTSEDLAVEMKEVNDQLLSHEKSVVFEISTSYDHGLPKLHCESPERQHSSPTQEEDRESTAAHVDKEDTSECMQLCQKLCEDRDKALHRCNLLQMKLAEFFHRKAQDDTQLHREVPLSDQPQEYDNYINILTDLKQQLTTESETAQQQAEEQSSKSQEKLDKVENEWRAYVGLKQDVAVSILSRRLGKQAAETKVEASLTTEELLQHELIKLRCKHIKLKIQIHRLEAELRRGETQARDTLSLQFEQLHAERLELKKQTEKQNEESLKLQKKISSSLELLSNVKEKLFWSQMEVQAKAEQLAVMEATVARKRDLLTRTRQVRNSLQKDNLRLKEHRGLLGNRTLLQDFEYTVDASDHLEEQLEDLKCRQGQIVFSCSRWKKKLETN